MSDVAVPPAIGFVEYCARLRSTHYREEAERFRSLAAVEHIAALRRHLTALARQYEQLAEGGTKARG